ncbi:uncharacterized protein TrAFT101_004743 [Trichoderma asperellum]|uniref:uncharacterized protein n=1 Tax=Trichoderma asperellum TaxID=101201 RepID=UPI003319A43F|nr:hypothetical protein TrAFT101_004743 [Trichoderma asperellum]
MSIGVKGIVPSLAKAGAHGLVLVARDEAKLKDVEAEVLRINPKVETLLVALDITNETAVEQLFASIRERYGRPADILVANAAVSAATNGGGPVLHEVAVDKWWSDFLYTWIVKSFSSIVFRLPR